MKTPLSALMGMALLSGNVFAQQTPNVIFLMADDMGWGDVGFNGNKIIKTPHLDQLAADALVFDRFYTGSSVSSPTRASVLTGRNPFRTGVFDANVGIIRPEEQTLPELLKDKGYLSGHFGKWHLGTLTYQEKDANRGCPENKHLYNLPAEHGYDDSFVTESKVPTYNPMIRPATCNNRFWDYTREGDAIVSYNTYYWKHNGEKETENLEGDDSRVIMDRVIPFIQKAQDLARPFFSVVWFHTPHLPCVAGPEYAALYPNMSLEERNYYGCITALDDQVGRLIDYLKQNNLYDNTLICFCSDNGPEVRTPGTAAHLRGKKRDLYEGGIRVPSFIVYPGKDAAKGRIQSIASTCDYLPTLVDMLQLRLPSNQLDGVSILPLLKGQQPMAGKQHVVCYKKQGAVIEQQYKLYYSQGRYELYDIEQDPSEQHDLAAQHPDIVKRLKQTLDERLCSLKASFAGEEYGTGSYLRVPQKWIDIKRN